MNETCSRINKNRNAESSVETKSNQFFLCEKNVQTSKKSGEEKNVKMEKNVARVAPMTQSQNVATPAQPPSRGSLMPSRRKRKQAANPGTLSDQLFRVLYKD